MAYKTIRTKRTLHGREITTVRREWTPDPVTDPRVYIGYDDIAQSVINEPIEYIFKGKKYIETPKETIEDLDRVLTHPMTTLFSRLNAKERANAMAAAVRVRIEDLKAQQAAQITQNRKEGNTMAFNNFTDYLKKAKAIIDKAQQERAEASTKWENDRARYEAELGNSKTDSKAALYARAEMARSEDVYNEAVEGITSYMKDELAKNRDALKNHVESFYKINPALMDSNTVTLVNSGALSDSDIISMVDDYTGNPTMLKFLNGSIKDKESDAAINLAYNIKHMQDGRELAIYDGLVTSGVYSIGSDTILAKTHEKIINNNFDSWCEDMGGLFAHPTATETDNGASE